MKKKEEETTVTVIDKRSIELQLAGTHALALPAKGAGIRYKATPPLQLPLPYPKNEELRQKK
jgi:hypothetical protein